MAKNNKGTTNTNNGYYRVVAVVLAVVILAVFLVAGFGSSWFKNGDITTWFNNWGKGDQSQTVPPADDGDENDGSGLIATAYSISADDYAAYGVSPQALEAKNIVVQFDPADTTDKRVEFSFAWENPNSEWASGKSVTEYIGYTPAADHGASCSVWATKAYGETIICTVSWYVNPAKKTTLRLEYVARFSSGSEIELNFNYGQDNGFDFYETLKKASNFGAGSVMPSSFTICGLEFYFEQEWVEDYQLHEDYITYDMASIFEYNSTLKFDDFGTLEVQICMSDLVYGFNTGMDPYLGYFFVDVDFYYGNEVIYNGDFCIDFHITQEFVNFFSIPANSLSVPNDTIIF